MGCRIAPLYIILRDFTGLTVIICAGAVINSEVQAHVGITRKHSVRRSGLLRFRIHWILHDSFHWSFWSFGFTWSTRTFPFLRLLNLFGILERGFFLFLHGWRKFLSDRLFVRLGMLRFLFLHGGSFWSIIIRLCWLWFLWGLFSNGKTLLVLILRTSCLNYLAFS